LTLVVGSAGSAICGLSRRRPASWPTGGSRCCSAAFPCPSPVPGRPGSTASGWRCSRAADHRRLHGAATCAVVL